MSAWLAVGGWTLAALLGGRVLELRRRLELVARAEHELRGPAAILLLAVEHMRRKPAGRLLARPLETELERLRAGLADLTAARTGKRRNGRARPGELEPLVRSELEAWRPALWAAGRPVRFDWRVGRAAVRADRGRVAQALGNVVANAAEHGEGPIELRAERNGKAVRVEVRNRRGRGRGLEIAADAARDVGGTLHVCSDGDEVVTALELPEDRDLPPAA